MNIKEVFPTPSPPIRTSCLSSDDRAIVESFEPFNPIFLKKKEKKKKEKQNNNKNRAKRFLVP